MRRICTICARGGSKGVKGKNIRELAGLPMIAHSILQAKNSKLFDFIAVSSDSEEILKVAKDHGVDFCIRRPDELATDTAAKIPVIRHCVQESEERSGVTFDTCVDLDCTSPLRFVSDIQAVVELLESSDSENIITGMPSRRSPYFNLVEDIGDNKIVLSKNLPARVVRRQDAPKSYDMNASIYAWKRSYLSSCDSVFLPNTRIFVMPEERSIDIDSELDFEFVSFLMGKRNEFAK